MSRFGVAAALLAAGLTVWRLPSALGDERTSESCDAAGFLQHSKRAVAETTQTSTSETCTDLINEGTHFSINVEVGTPSQTFKVVADTGSNSLIVDSCLCQERGSCSSTSRCFKGGGYSSSYSVFVKKEDNEPLQEVLTFGSGKIAGVFAKDVVKIGNMTTVMEDGLLLMVDQRLDFNTDNFEGILGLGPPIPADKALVRKDMAFFQGRHLLDGDGSRAGAGAAIVAGTAMPKQARQAEDKDAAITVDEERTHMPHASGFMEQSGTSRFSMCFGDQTGGVLRIGGAKAEDRLASVGTYHWGVDLRGISVGDGEAMQHLKLCSREEMKKDQETACSMLPDSGTTLMMGPEDQVKQLLGTICDKWERCSKKHKEVEASGEYDEPVEKGAIVTMLLKDCASWLSESEHGLDELPPIQFHVAGAGHKDGAKPKALELAGVDYVVSYVDALHPKQVRTCKPAFGKMSFDTAKNGPVWIVGVPLFYVYNVAYDLETKSIAFTSLKENGCGTCSKQIGLMGAGASTDAAGTAERAMLRHSPRQIWGEPRMPTSAFGEL